MRGVATSNTDERAGQLEGLGLLLLAAALAAFLAQAWEMRPHVDDAYIFYRYAQNFVDGNAFVYNPGEYVDGNTSFLWPWLIAAGMLFGAEAPTAGHVLSVACSLALLGGAFSYTAACLDDRERALAGAAPWIVLASVPFAIWSTRGMETPLFAAAIVGALAAEARGRRAVAVGALALAALARPEGLLLAAVLFGLAFHRRPGERGRVMVEAAFFSLPVLGMTGFRWLYFGSILPNTYHAKVGGGALAIGGYDLGSFLAGGPIWMLPAVVAAGLRVPALRPGLAFAATLAVYDVWVGGDALGHNRFLVPILAILACAAVSGAAATWRRSPHLGAALGSLVALGALWSTGVDGVTIFHAMVTGTAGEWASAAFAPAPRTAALAGLLLFASAGASIRLGRAWPILAGSLIALAACWLALPETRPEPDAPRLTRNRILAGYDAAMAFLEDRSRERAEVYLARHRPDALVAAAGIGVFGFYSQAPILDLYGLVDPVIARSERRAPPGSLAIPGHLRSNPDYVFSREPAYILIPREGSRGEVFGTAAEIDLWGHPDLAAHYAWDEEIAGYRRRGGQ